MERPTEGQTVIHELRPAQLYYRLAEEMHVHVHARSAPDADWDDTVYAAGLLSIKPLIVVRSSSPDRSEALQAATSVMPRVWCRSMGRELNMASDGRTVLKELLRQRCAASIHRLQPAHKIGQSHWQHEKPYSSEV